MTVVDLIAELEKSNPEAKVFLTIGNEDEDVFSTSEIEIHHQEVAEYIEIFASDDATQQI